MEPRWLPLEFSFIFLILFLSAEPFSCHDELANSVASNRCHDAYTMTMSPTRFTKRASAAPTNSVHKDDICPDCREGPIDDFTDVNDTYVKNLPTSGRLGNSPVASPESAPGPAASLAATTYSSQTNEAMSKTVSSAGGYSDRSRAKFQALLFFGFLVTYFV